MKCFSSSVHPTTWQRSTELEKHFILLTEGKSKEHRLGGTNIYNKTAVTAIKAIANTTVIFEKDFAISFRRAPTLCPINVVAASPMPNPGI